MISGNMRKVRVTAVGAKRLGFGEGTEFYIDTAVLETIGGNVIARTLFRNGKRIRRMVQVGGVDATVELI